MIKDMLQMPLHSAAGSAFYASLSHYLKSYKTKASCSHNIIRII